MEQVDSEKSVKNVHPKYNSEEENYISNEDLNTIRSDPEPVIINLSDSEKTFQPFFMFSILYCH